MQSTHAVGADGAFLTINREERDVLWEEAAADVGAAGDIAIMLRRGPGPHDHETRLRIARGLHMLDDLGWDQFEDPRSEYHLTVPVSWLFDYLRDCIRAQYDGALSSQETAARGESYGHVLSDYEIREEERRVRQQRRAARVLRDVLERISGKRFEVGDERTLVGQA